MSGTTSTTAPSTGTGSSNTNTSAIGDTGTTDTGSLPVLPPQYSTGNLGFFTRQTEPVPTGVTVGPDGALYVSELTGIPYASGYSTIYRIANPSASTGYNGTIPSGVPQAYASGFTSVVSLGFNNSNGDMYVLQYDNAAGVYDPTINPADLPPDQLIQVAPDGTRTTISGPELHLSQYLLVDQQTGDVYVSTDNNGPGTGEVIDYHTDPTTGAVTSAVVASGLNDPRGMAFGPDGNLYVLEQGDGTPSSSPDAANAPVIPFIPGQVSERGGYSGSITRVDITSPSGGQQRIYTGLPSFLEFNPTTGQDRVNAVGPNALTITPDGTVYIASGGGLAPETAASLGSFGNDLQGVLKLTGLFGSDPSQASYTPEFNALSYAAANGPDGATTQFNTESNLYDITQGPNGELYTVDAARNDVYGLSSDGSTVENATVLQKQPPILTPPQYAAVVAQGGSPSEEYAAEISNTTFKNANSLPNVPGNIPATAVPPTTGSGSSGPSTSSSPSTSGSSSSSGPSTSNMASLINATVAPGNGTNNTSPSSLGSSSASSSMTSTLPPHGEDTTGSGVTAGASSTSASGPTTSAGVPGVSPGAAVFPGPTDPTSPPVDPTNVYASSFEPFFGNDSPGPGAAPALPAGNGGTYTVSKLVVFGDRLADNGNAAALEESLGQAPGVTAATYSPTGDFSDGPKWTTDLAQMLGLTSPSQQENYAYEGASARDLGAPDPLIPDASQTPLSTFAGQIQQFQQDDGSFSPNDLVSVTFGGNDISLPSDESPTQGVTDSVNAIISGLGQLADMGAKHFLISDVPDITLAPLFSSPAFQAATGATPAMFQGLVDDFNSQLSSALTTFQNQTGLDVKTLDLNTLFNGIAATPSNYGFTNIAQPVLSSTPTPGSTPTYNPAIVGQDPQVEHGSLFLDPYFDPTALGQTLIAQTARNTLV